MDQQRSKDGDFDADRKFIHRARSLPRTIRPLDDSVLRKQMDVQQSALRRSQSFPHLADGQNTDEKAKDNINRHYGHKMSLEAAEILPVLRGAEIDTKNPGIVAKVYEPAEANEPLLHGNFLWRWREELRGDWSSFFLLSLLYTLQGVNLGMMAGIPLILQSKGVTYSQQSVFSFAAWPASLKMFWAPIVDACYIERIGRRKCWLIPLQYSIGLCMFLLAYKLGDLLESSEGSGPNVHYLMLMFLFLSILVASQDICVDGWALTMLSKKNVGYASTCQNIGWIIGFFIGNVVFLWLQAAEPNGIISSAAFIYFWGTMYMVTTTFVLFFKREVDRSETEDETSELSLLSAYKMLINIFRLKPVFILACILLTKHMAFGATEGITDLKLVELGVPREKLATLALFLTPVGVLLSLFIGRYAAGPRPLTMFLHVYPLCILLYNAVSALLVWITPTFRNEDGSYQMIFYVVYLISSFANQTPLYCLSLAMTGFITQKADPRVGGTYMTLLYALFNMGAKWPVTLTLRLNDLVTWKECLKPLAPNSSPSSALLSALNATFEMVGNQTSLLQGTSCGTKDLAQQCTMGGNVCEMRVDGYFILVAVCSLIGLFWWALVYRRVNHLQEVDKKDWSCMHSQKRSRQLYVPVE